MKRRTLLSLLCICCCAAGLFSQTLETNSDREKYFAFEVKQIDEFVERFNGDQDGFIGKYLSSKAPGLHVERASLLANLVNRYSGLEKSGITDSFLQQVLRRNNPTFIDFAKPGCYAEVICKFDLKGKVIDVPLTLKLTEDTGNGAKWMIVGITYNATQHYSAVRLNRPSTGRFISTASFATNFLSLASIFESPGIYDCLDATFFKSSQARSFLSYLNTGKLRFKYVKRVRYHFLQVQGWIFTVDYFKRKSVNSGWLISQVLTADQSGCELYKSKLCGRLK